MNSSNARRMSVIVACCLLPLLRVAPALAGPDATSGSVALAGGQGSIEGMGESLAPALATGGLSFSLPLKLPAGRNGFGPSLALGYMSGAPSSALGLGWTLQVPFIARSLERGVPRYRDQPTYHGEEDRFSFGGDDDLVPVDSGAIGARDGGSVPPELMGYQQYRSRIEGSFLRFFRSPDNSRWVAQTPDGGSMEFGRISDGPVEMVSASALALQGQVGRVHHWWLIRHSDSHGSTLYYRYSQADGQVYLQDIHYVSPASCGRNGDFAATRGCAQPLSSYAVRVGFVYEARPDVTVSYAYGDAVRSAQRLVRVEITARESDRAQRTLVRRYRLSYDPGSYLSLLTALQLEGRPDQLDATTGSYVGSSEVSESSLSAAVVGRMFPAIRFSYTGNHARALGVQGFPALSQDAFVTPVDRPALSLASGLVGLYDVNRDGLLDVVDSDSSRYVASDGRPAAGVYFNGFAGAGAVPAEPARFSHAVALGVDSLRAPALRFDRATTRVLDLEGDGAAELLHLPRAQAYGYFVPVRDNTSHHPSPRDQGYNFAYVPVQLPAGDADPRIDLTQQGANIRFFDVNGDSLLDAVMTASTTLRVWLNLGTVPGGEGRFGTASYNQTSGSWILSTAPRDFCIPRLASSLSFASPAVRVGDMNGDGLDDLVWLASGQITYWPSRGTGFFGTGTECSGAGVVQNGHVTMSGAPSFPGGATHNVFVADVDGDGQLDLLRTTSSLQVWYNRGGQGYTSPVTRGGIPGIANLEKQLAFVDVNGSGTLDLFIAASTQWSWLDLMGGVKQRLLSGMDNGLGALTSVEYSTAARDYLRDLLAAATCEGPGCERFVWSALDESCDQPVLEATGRCTHRSDHSPVLPTVVSNVTARDRMNVLGREENVLRTEYAYHDAYYDGLSREFRGFRAVETKAVGDATHPTSISRSYLHVGQRPSELATDRLTDNPKDALHGQVYWAETLDAGGVFLSGIFTSFRVRDVISGLDGRVVRHAYADRVESLSYSSVGFVPTTPGSVIESLDSVSWEALTPTGAVVQVENAWGETFAPPLRGGPYVRLRQTVDEVDSAGHVLTRTRVGRVSESEAVVQQARFALIDPARWMWRTQSAWTEGQSASPPLGLRTYTYDAAGNSVREEAIITVPMAFEFSGDARGAESFVQADSTVVSTVLHDSWGGPVVSCLGGDFATGPDQCLRLLTITRDSEYEQLVEREETATGDVALVDELSWDRGLGQVLTATTPGGSVTRVGYDGLGRPAFARAPPAAGCEESTVPNVRYRYELTADPANAPISYVEMHEERSCTALGADTRIVRTYLDGMLRPRALLSSAEAPYGWERDGLVVLDAKGAVARSLPPAAFAIASPTAIEVLALPSGPSVRTRYDAFGRELCERDLDESLSCKSYHALAEDDCDALDMDPQSVAYETCSTTRYDGHGRVVDVIERNRKDTLSALETYRLWSDYRADGMLVTLTRAQSSDDAPRSSAQVVDGHVVSRTFTYDSHGRRIAASDPDVDARRPFASEGSRTHRYLYNGVGDIVAARDPRGCGSNYYYDRAGRQIGERYVSCGGAQDLELPSSSVPAGSVALGRLSASVAVDVRDHFDRYPEWVTGALLPSTPFNHALSLPTATSDRAKRAVFGYDSRGGQLFEARQVALLGSPGDIVDLRSRAEVNSGAPPAKEGSSASQVAYDEVHTYVQTQRLDHAQRVVERTFPSDPDFASSLGAPLVRGRMRYNARGLPLSSSLVLDGGERPIVSRVAYTADGLVSQVSYGDGKVGRAATESYHEYDLVGQPVLSSTVRTPTAESSPNRPLSAVSLVHHQTYGWDAVHNLRSVTDGRLAMEWPAGHRPQSVAITHDALYRVMSVDYAYSQDDGSTGPSDAASDYRAELSRLKPHDPMRTDAAPGASDSVSSRVENLVYDHDWLANLTELGDDAQMFHERSLGRLVHGSAEPNGRPSALRLAANVPTTEPPAASTEVRGGYLELDYSEGGNVTRVTVHGECRDASPSARCWDDEGLAFDARRTALRMHCRCGNEQHYEYRWDEQNRLSDARRYDGEGDNFGLAVHFRYRYDAENQRLIKAVSDELGERIALYVYPGDFERRGLIQTGERYEASEELGTETQYMVSGARVVWNASDDLLGLDGNHRITLPITDLVSSTSAVLELDSGELIEASTYYPNGARETLRAHEAHTFAREPAGFTGKEADSEVGLTYFGERYLLPHLGHWASPDPLQLHEAGGGEALNNYHYIAGNLLQGRDPIGLDAGTGQGLEVDLSSVDPGSVWQPTDTLAASAGLWVPLERVYFNDQDEATAIIQTNVSGKFFRNIDVWLFEQNGKIYEFDEAAGKYSELSDWQIESRIYSYDNAAAADPARWKAAWAKIDTMTAGVMAMGEGLWFLAQFTPVGRAIEAADTAIACIDGSSWDCVLSLAPGAMGRAGKLKRAPGAGGRCAGGRCAVPCHCFAAGTLVHTDTGLVPIEQLVSGDLVWARDDATGQVALRPVDDTFVRSDRPLLLLTFEQDGGEQLTLEATPEHPFYTRDRGMVGALALRINEPVHSLAAGWLRLISSTWVEASATVYNLEVEGYHTFFVGEQGAWVHNCSRPGRHGKQQRLRDLAGDDKLGRADRGWIKNEMRHVENGNRSTIRLPGNSRRSKVPGKELAHRRGKRAKHGHGYDQSVIQDADLHRLEHKYEGR